jgi:heterodisulfide reductase subunit B
LALQRHPEMHTMPIVYFTQLMALAFECGDTALGPDLHYINPDPLLEEKGLI